MVGLCGMRRSPQFAPGWLDCGVSRPTACESQPRERSWCIGAARPSRSTRFPIPDSRFGFGVPTREEMAPTWMNPEESKMNLPPALTPDESKILTERLLSGDPLAREQLILGSLRLVAAIAHEAGDWWEEAFSVGCVALVQAVDAIRDSRNPPAYISMRVRGTLCNQRQRPMRPLPKHLVATQSPSETDIVDAIQEAAENATDLEMLYLRRDGLTLTEISERVDRPRSTVHDRFRYLRQKISDNFTA